MSHRFMDLMTKKAPEFPKDGKWVNTKPLSLAKLKGKTIVMHFPSENSTHNPAAFQKLESRFSDEQVLIMLIVSKRSAKSNSKRPILIDGKNVMVKNYFVSTLPSTIIVGSNGKMAFNLEGECNTAQLLQLVETALDRGV